MTLNRTEKTQLATLTGAVVTAGIASIVKYVADKRNAKREAEEQLSRNVAYAHLTETLEAITEDLDLRIQKARKHLTDYDFNEIIENNF